MEKERKPARREKSIEEARPHNKGARLTLASAARAMAYNRGGGGTVGHWPKPPPTEPPFSPTKCKIPLRKAKSPHTPDSTARPAVTTPKVLPGRLTLQGMLSLNIKRFSQILERMDKDGTGASSRDNFVRACAALPWSRSSPAPSRAKVLALFDALVSDGHFDVAIRRRALTRAATCRQVDPVEGTLSYAVPSLQEALLRPATQMLQVTPSPAHAPAPDPDRGPSLVPDPHVNRRCSRRRSPREPTHAPTRCRRGSPWARLQTRARAATRATPR